MDVAYSEHFKYVSHAPLELEVRMGYREKGSQKNEWNELTTSNVTRILECTIPDEEVRFIIRFGLISVYFTCFRRRKVEHTIVIC